MNSTSGMYHLRVRTSMRPVPEASPCSIWRSPVSPTFHGRDIFAPVAAYLSLGISPSQLGPTLTTWRELAWPVPAPVLPPAPSLAVEVRR